MNIDDRNGQQPEIQERFTRFFTHSGVEFSKKKVAAPPLQNKYGKLRRSLESVGFHSQDFVLISKLHPRPIKNEEKKGKAA